MEQGIYCLSCHACTNLQTSKQVSYEESSPRTFTKALAPGPPLAAGSTNSDTSERGALCTTPPQASGQTRRLGTAVGKSLCRLECSTGRRRFKGTEDQREKAPSLLNLMLAVTDSFTQRREEEREKQKHYFSTKGN